jgi:hypothetical protein
VKGRLWWAEAESSSDEKMIDRASLIAWFRESAKTFKATTSENKIPPGVPPPVPEIYWHGKNGRPCACAGCCAGAAVLINDPVTRGLTETIREPRRAARKSA